MIKRKGNLSLAIKELTSDKNNAVAHVFKKASITKKGLLADAVYTIKDNFATSDAPSCASSNTLKGYWPGYDSDVYKKLKQNGATCVGKTHLDELGLGGYGIFSSGGVITNPLDKKRIVGGSTSGGAATLSDAINFAIGSDTGDSVRLPAAYIGKVGFKPSYGAVSRYGLFAYSSSLDTVGWITHNVEDAVLIAKALFGISKNDLTTVYVPIQKVEKQKPTKIRYLNCLDKVENYVASIFRKVLKQLEEEGVEIERVEPNIKILKSIWVVYKIIAFSESRSNLSAINGISFGNSRGLDHWQNIYKNTRSQGFGKQAQYRMIMGSYFLNANNYENLFLRAQKVRRLIKEYFDNLMEGCDFLLSPSTPSIAPFFGEEKSGDYMSSILTFSNLTGGPSIALPMGKHEGLPLNLNMDYLTKKDEKLLGHALWMEKFLKEKL